jgi:uncharacterized protein YdaU (DUF1376 family)
MHFYPHNIPDFNNATRHLTRVERSVYRDAIEMYYDTESPLPAGDFNRLARLLLCTTKDEKDALQLVLDEFFTLSDGVYIHARCDHEIEKYRSNSTAKARAGKASAEARKNRASTPVEHVLNSVEQNKNYEIVNNNQEIVITPQAATPKKRVSRLPDDWKPDRVYYDEAKILKPDMTDEWFKSVAHKFKDYWIAKSGKDATKVDWLATWRNWIRREVENAKTGSGAKKSYGEQRSELFDAVTDYDRATNF